MLSLNAFAEILKIQPEHQHFTVNHLSSDSRSIQSGDIFFAIAGELVDGAEYIASACAKGAIAVVCSPKHLSKVPKGHLAIAAEDPLLAYRQASHIWRSQFAITIVAVGGSVGKTTTKEFIAAIFKAHFTEVLKTTGSQNGFLGIPMTLAQLRSTHAAAVIEIGIDAKGSMTQHAEIVKPSIALLTAIAEEHLDQLDDLKTVAEEECTLLQKTLQSGGEIIINLDDSLMVETLAKDVENAKSYGFSLEGSIDTVNERRLVGNWHSQDQSIEVSGMGLSKENFALPLAGKHNASNLLAAIACARRAGVDAETIRKGIAQFKNAPGRSEVVSKGPKLKIVCDYYNACPASVKAGVSLAAGLNPQAELWVVLGDMLELGEQKQDLHAGLADTLREHRVKASFTFGPLMMFLNKALKGSQDHHQHFDTKEELIQTLNQRLKQYVLNDESPPLSILIKGSRGMKMEDVYNALVFQDTES